MTDPSPPPWGEPAEILLVEDNPGDVRLVQEELRFGHLHNEVHVTTDGLEAMAFLHQDPPFEDAPRPDLILLDLNLPHKTGQEVLEEVREDPALASIPVIVLTATPEHERVLRDEGLPAEGYLTKPITVGTLLRAIAEVGGYGVSLIRLPA